ncbi:hypothetical protein [Nocardia sp. CNY236]|uniref:hypothetical protein n=1 Tax=Nocardia sp. CNY236 TaxID=1169152 RepID=UPI00048D3C61|nr:hypothetical protein [Nocardia sp. CNY236]
MSSWYAPGWKHDTLTVLLVIRVAAQGEYRKPDAPFIPRIGDEDLMHYNNHVIAGCPASGRLLMVAIGVPIADTPSQCSLVVADG